MPSSIVRRPFAPVVHVLDRKLLVLESKTGILTNKLSDHQPYFMSVNITQKKEPLPKYVKINIVSTEAMHNVRHDIKSEEIYNKFNKKTNRRSKLKL